MKKEIRRKLFNINNWFFCGDNEGLYILFNQRILMYRDDEYNWDSNIYFWYNKKLYKIKNTKLKYDNGSFLFGQNFKEKYIHRVLNKGYGNEEGKFIVYIPFTFKEIKFGNWFITKILFFRILWFYKLKKRNLKIK